MNKVKHKPAEISGENRKESVEEIPKSGWSIRIVILKEKRSEPQICEGKNKL